MILSYIAEKSQKLCSKLYMNPKLTLLSSPKTMLLPSGALMNSWRSSVVANRWIDWDSLDKWLFTLTKVGNFSGYHVHEDMSQVDIIHEVVDRILHEINPSTLDVAKYPVGMDYRVEDITSLLSNVTKGVIRIGLHGMGGLGKTTLAKVVFNQHYHRFQGSYFLPNIREASETKNKRNENNVGAKHDIGGMGGLKELPIELGNIKSLRELKAWALALKYLDISCCTSLEVLPVELGNLNPWRSSMLRDKIFLSYRNQLEALD
ncbi:hypothetical protein AgCh_023923 [Apium graveolens]